jgi:ribosome-binding protein aMBF1 (putative translation factor)
MLDTSFHRRRVAERKDDPEYRAEYERMSREIAQVNAVMRALDGLREQGAMSKAELARAIGRNDAVVRRFFTAQSNPELRTIAAMAEALDADIRIVPRRKTARRRAAAEVAGG